MARGRKSLTNDTFKSKTLTWKIAVYIRLSREDGNDESESVTNQKKILKEYLEQFFDEQFTVADYYIDDGLSGTDDTRENFMRMIQDIEKGTVNCIICKTLARAFRNYSDQGYYLEYYFPQKNVRFISTGDPKIDTYKNPEAITGLEVPITGLMNDRFAARTSSDIRRTFNTKRRNGEFIGAFPPYGYLKSPENKNKLILDPDIVPIKREILSWVLGGMSLNGAARKLNDMGIPNPTAYKHSLGWKYNNPHSLNDGLWRGSTLKRMLLDKINLGHMVQGKQRVVSYKVHDKIATSEDEWFVKENTHEPTFTEDEYSKLVNILHRDTREIKGKGTLHLFSGFLHCSGCNKAMTRKTSKYGTYYACRTYTEQSKTKCTKHSIRIDRLENAVLKSIQLQVSLVSSIADIVDRLNEGASVDTKSKRIEKLLAEKNRELIKVKTVSSSLYTDWKMGEITHEKYRFMENKFDEQISQLKLSIENLEGEQRELDTGVNSSATVFTEFKKLGNITELDRNILTTMVETIYVHENNEITIKFKHENELSHIMEIAQQNGQSLDFFYPISVYK